jgi:hypothetical protein
VNSSVCSPVLELPDQRLKFSLFSPSFCDGFSITPAKYSMKYP